jgi:hypothetical protein
VNSRIYDDLFGCFRDAFVVLRDARIYETLREITSKYW